MKLHHLTILARDVARTRKFYCDRLGFEEIDSGDHPEDPGTRELVLQDGGGVFWIFHFYPRSHRSVAGEGGVARLLVGCGGGESRVHDPDGVEIHLMPGLPSGLAAVELVSDCSEFWKRWTEDGWLHLLPVNSAEPHQLGYGSVHHLGISGGMSLPSNGVSGPKATRWGKSQYLYSPCGMLLELLAE